MMHLTDDEEIMSQIDARPFKEYDGHQRNRKSEALSGSHRLAWAGSYAG